MTIVPAPAAPVKVGLIGAGGIAGAHIKGYHAHSDVVSIVAVADAFPASAQSRAAEFDAEVFDNYNTMLAEADIDAVDICLPHHLHKDAIIAAARAGKHILCEKPLCMTLEEALEIRTVIRETGVTLMSAHNQLFQPSVAKAKELIDGGLLGKLYEARTTCSFLAELDASSVGWRGDKKQTGGGELIDSGYHPAYMLMYLVGAAPTEVTAMLSNHRMDFLTSEDSANLLVRFENGVVGNVLTSWAYVPSSNTELFSIAGELGSMYSDGTNLHYTLTGQEPVTLSFDEVHDITEEIGHFGRALVSGERPVQNEDDGIAVLTLILAAYRSAANKTIESINSI